MAAKTQRNIYQVKVTLVGYRPPIWRRLLVPGTISLLKFHDVLQFAMGWDDYHLHQFRAAGQLYGLPDPEFDRDIKNETRAKLNQLLKQKNDSLIYEYDFGDGWEHKVVLEKILPLEKDADLPRCIAGKRACPPEDCGGVWGYQEFVEAIQDPSHPRYHELLEWIGGEFDPEYFDIEGVNEALLEFCR